MPCQSSRESVQVDESLQQSLNRGTFECVICLCRIGRTEPIHTCCECGNCVHWNCFQRWAKKVPEVAKRNVQDEYPCPACQTWQVLLLEPRCFCGKVVMDGQRRPPSANAHSCGRRCGRKLCIHGGCSQVCHPGPCTPCPGTIEVSCRCGREKFTYRCAEYRKQLVDTCTERLQCGRPCGFEKSCGHRCSKICHPMNAHNGAAAEDEACDETVWMQCALHDQPFPMRCPGVRHASPVVCTEILQHHCRCGSERFSLTCIDLMDVAYDPGILLCDRLCGKLLSCNRHRCSERCCNDTRHECMRSCNRAADGRRSARCSHPCPLRCHQGACPPCATVSHEPLVCACGRQRIEPPVPCGTLPPICNAPCQKERPCRHPCALGRCHAGDCPKCLHLVLRECIGGHKEHRQIPCSAKPFRCFRACNQLLPCGRHRCKRRCHDWRNPDDSCTKGDPTHPCEMPMSDTRQVCALPCGHSGMHQGGALSAVRPGPSISDVSMEADRPTEDAFARSQPVCKELNANEPAATPGEVAGTCSAPVWTGGSVVVEDIREESCPGSSPTMNRKRDGQEAEAETPYSLFLLEMARNHWEEFLELERLLGMVATATQLRWQVVALNATNARMRAAQHELASLHYKLHTRSAASHVDRHVVVTHLHGVSRVPKPLLTQVVQQKEFLELKKERDRASRCLAVRVSPFIPAARTGPRSTTGGAANDASNDMPLWSKDFRSHAGNYSIIARNVDGFDFIEFSTPERCQSAWLSLRWKRHLVARKVSESELAKLDSVEMSRQGVTEVRHPLHARTADEHEIED